MPTILALVVTVFLWAFWTNLRKINELLDYILLDLDDVDCVWDLSELPQDMFCPKSFWQQLKVRTKLSILRFHILTEVNDRVATTMCGEQIELTFRIGDVNEARQTGLRFCERCRRLVGKPEMQEQYEEEEDQIEE